jgi:hypothetical protein
MAQLLAVNIHRRVVEGIVNNEFEIEREEDALS